MGGDSKKVFGGIYGGEGGEEQAKTRKLKPTDRHHITSRRVGAFLIKLSARHCGQNDVVSPP